MIKVAFFDAKAYDKPSFEQYGSLHEIRFKYLETKLNEDTVDLAKGRIAGQRIVGAVHAEILLVIGKGFRLAIQDRRKRFKHSGIRKCFQHDFVCNAIKVALTKADTGKLRVSNVVLHRLNVYQAEFQHEIRLQK